MVIMGIDPGSRVTGCGVVSWDGLRLRHVGDEILSIAQLDMPERLRAIFEATREWIARYAPDEAAIEQVFVGRNIATALKLGKVCGVVTAAVALNGLPLAEYAPRRIKQAVVGVGGAEKAQVQHMVSRLLGVPEQIDDNAADALAVAICHAHTQQGLRRLAGGALQ